MNGIPLIPLIKAPYPLNAFHLVVREAAYEVLENIQAPDALVGMVSIISMTIACQGLINAKLPSGKISAVSLNALSIIESGDGKTAVSNRLLKPFMDSDSMAKERYDLSKEKYEIDLEIWKAKKSAILREMIKTSNSLDSSMELEVQLAEHIKLKPKKPRLRYFLRQNITPKALMEALEGDSESVAMWNDEGDEQLKSATMSHFGLMNRTWDSPPVMTLDRAGGEQIIAKNPRASVCILTQWQPLKDFLDKRGSSARGTGHWARYLVGKSNSMQGYRKVTKNEQVWTCLLRFHSRISEMIDKYIAMIDNGKVELETVEFSDDAKARWFDLAQQTENLLRKGEYLSDINDHAAKLMEILGRLSATMHYFNGEGGKITLDTLERAFTLVQWHIEEFKCLFSPQYRIPQEQVDAREISSWLRTRIWGGVTSDTVVPKNVVLNRGPVRLSRRLDAALDLLVAQGGIQVFQGYLPKDKKKYVRLMNPFFANVIA